MVVFVVVKWYTVRKATKWRYAVCKAKLGQYAVRKGGRGVTLIVNLTIKAHASAQRLQED